jgi:hypothetical protein
MTALLDLIAKVREDAHAETDRGTPLQCSALELAAEVERIYMTSPTARLVADRK